MTEVRDDMMFYTPQPSNIRPDHLHEAYIGLMKNSIVWENDVQAALQLIATTCSRALGVSRASIWHKNGQEKALTCRVQCEDNYCEIDPQKSITAEDHRNYFKAFDTERVIAASDALRDVRTYSFSQDFQIHGVQSCLDATLREEGHSTGIIRFELIGETRNWSEAEQSFAVSISDLLSQVIIFHSLKDSKDRYQKVFDSAGDTIIVMHDYKMVDCNLAALNLFRCSKEELHSKSQSHFWPDFQACGKKSKELALKYFEAVKATGYQRFEWRIRDWYGREFDSEISLTQVDLENKPHLVISIRDISEKKNANQKIRDLAVMQQAIFDGANYSIIATDDLGIIHTFNRAAEKLLGYRAEDVIGKSTPDIFHDAEETAWRAKCLEEELGHNVAPNFDAYVVKSREGQVEQIECSYVHKQGKKIPVLLSVSTLRNNDRQISGFLSIASDISDKKKANEDLLLSKREMEHRAMHDTLTGLPNRTRLHDMARVAIHDAATQKKHLALMLLDLNRFKDVNDTLGHAAGDLMLKSIAMRLQKKLAFLGAHLYRLGGDEFAIMVHQIDSQQAAVDIANQIGETLRKPIIVDDITLELGGSIGIALYPEHGDNSHALLRCADVAMYQAKSTSQIAVSYEQQFDSHSPKRLSLMSELGSAIRESQLVLYYQPRLNIQQNTCISCEALIRWQHPKHGLIPPDEFIPFAEVSDFIHPLGYWVLDTAVQQIRNWLDQGKEISVSINLSARNLLDLTFSQRIETTLREYNVPPHLLEIEITESALINDPERALKTINRIHQLGVRFAIDDFGTGYSSLSYLKRLPIDTLKIDKTFISEMLKDEQDAVIVRSTISLAHSFDLEVVAEGVEDSETLTALKFLNCEQVQGFLICKPKPKVEFETWLEDFNTSVT